MGCKVSLINFGDMLSGPVELHLMENTALNTSITQTLEKLMQLCGTVEGVEGATLQTYQIENIENNQLI